MIELGLFLTKYITIPTLLILLIIELYKHFKRR
jgi:hypothetical protein